MFAFRVYTKFYGETNKMSENIDIAKIAERIYHLEKPSKFVTTFSGGFHWMNHSYKLLLEDINVRTLLKGSFVFSSRLVLFKNCCSAT